MPDHGHRAVQVRSKCNGELAELCEVRATIASHGANVERGTMEEWKRSLSSQWCHSKAASVESCPVDL